MKSEEFNNFLWIAKRSGARLKYQAFLLVKFLFGFEIRNEPPFIIEEKEILSKAADCIARGVDKEISLMKKGLNPLHYAIADEAEKNKWIAWLSSLNFADKENCKSLATKAFMLAYSLGMLSMKEESERVLQLLKNMEEVSYMVHGTMVEIHIRASYSKHRTLLAKISASSKTKRASYKQARIEAIYKKHEYKSSIAFRTEAMEKIGWTEDYIKRKVKEMKNTTRKTDGIP